MTEILMMTLTPQLRKIAIKKRASHPSFIREPDLDFGKLVDNLEQAEITMKIEETENLKLQHFNNIHTTTSQINHEYRFIQKNHRTFNIYQKNPKFKGKPSIKNDAVFAKDMDAALLNADKNIQNIEKKSQKYREPNNLFHQYMKKDQNLPNKNTQSNNISGKPLPNYSNFSRHQSPYNSNYRGRSLNQRNLRDFSQNRHSRSNSRKIQYRNNYSRSNSRQPEFSFENRSHHTPGIDTIPMTDLETLHIIEIEIIPAIEIETIQMIEIKDIKTIDHVIFLTTDQFIKDQFIETIKKDHAIIHKIGIQTITIDKETTPPHRNNTRHQDSEQKYRSNTSKHQSQINQAQTTEEVKSDPPGIDITESTEL